MKKEPPKRPEQRTALLDTMSDRDYVTQFCEGNPGCATVVARIANHTDAGGSVFTTPKPILTVLVSMNIRGAQLWVLYKDIFHGNVGLMLDAVGKRDPKMIERLNAICYHPREDLIKIPYHQLAVTDGWQP